MIHSCTVHGHQLLAYVCFHGWLFANCVKPSWCITGPTGPLESINQNWLCAKLLPMAILIYLVVCVHSCHLLETQHYSLCSNGSDSLPPACHPHPPPHPTPTPPPSHPPTPPTRPPPYKRHP